MDIEEKIKAIFDQNNFTPFGEEDIQDLNDLEERKNVILEAKEVA